MSEQNPNEKAEFLPFHAINEFMRNDYRLTVVRNTLHGLPALPGKYSAPIDQLTKKFVRVPGFRNSVKAPARVKATPLAETFEKNPELVAAILNAWAELQHELRQQVFDLLKGRGWEVLPVEGDRTKFPGFLVRWPKDQNFETLNQAYKEAYPESKATNDDITLMLVWVSMRLPFKEEELEVLNQELKLPEWLKGQEQEGE